MTLDPEFASFARLIDSLSPWLDQVVIIGGWAHRLYRFHPAAQRLDYPSLSTLDTDVAVPARIAVKEQDIHERLIANGFREEFLGNNRPPATHYHLGSEKSGFYAEFLTPLTGSAHTRTGRSNATVRIGGVSSQKLRHLEILLNAPWNVELSDSNGFPSGRAVRVQIASPVSFMAQKILIHQKRGQSERAKDILYIHDTLQLFGARFPELRTEWLDCVKLQLHGKNAAVVGRAPVWQREEFPLQRPFERHASSDSRESCSEAIPRRFRSPKWHSVEREAISAVAYCLGSDDEMGWMWLELVAKGNC